MQVPRRTMFSRDLGRTNSPSIHTIRAVLSSFIPLDLPERVRWSGMTRAARGPGTSLSQQVPRREGVGLSGREADRQKSSMSGRGVRAKALKVR